MGVVVVAVVEVMVSSIKSTKSIENCILKRIFFFMKVSVIFFKFFHFNPQILYFSNEYHKILFFSHDHQQIFHFARVYHQILSFHHVYHLILIFTYHTSNQLYLFVVLVSTPYFGNNKKTLSAPCTLHPANLIN